MDAAPGRERSWANIVSISMQNRHKFRHLLTNDELRIRIQFFCVYTIFCIVSSFMTVVNVFTGWHLLMLATLVFAVANLINIILCLPCEKTELFSRYLFAGEILVLFTFFAITGEPEGFSAIWMALLPATGLLLYRMTYGVLLTAVQFVVLVFLFWTPAGRDILMYSYTESFLLRFPLLYVAFFAVGVFFEYIRYATQQELLEARERYRHLSHHDVLTGLYNRSFFNDSMNIVFKTKEPKRYAVGILDLDNFKQVNDQFGHACGDMVLVRTAQVLSGAVGENGYVCRWGGEEFALLLLSARGAEDICQTVVQTLRETAYDFNGVSRHVTASIGLVTFTCHEGLDPNRIFIAADQNLYDAKAGGKDQCIATELPTEKQ